MAMINIDGVDLPAPIKLKPPNSDIDSKDSGRNELGGFQRDRVRQGLYKIELAWKNLSSSDLHLIKTAIKPSEFKFTFPSEVGFITKTMYAGDRDIDMVSYNSDFNKILWDISFNLIEI